MFGIKFMIGIVLILAGAAAIGLAYQKYKWALKMVFGKDRYKKFGPETLTMFMYILGGVLALLGVLIIT